MMAREQQNQPGLAGGGRWFGAAGSRELLAQLVLRADEKCGAMLERCPRRIGREAIVLELNARSCEPGRVPIHQVMQCLAGLRRQTQRLPLVPRYPSSSGWVLFDDGRAVGAAQA